MPAHVSSRQLLNSAAMGHVVNSCLPSAPDRQPACLPAASACLPACRTCLPRLHAVPAAPACPACLLCLPAAPACPVCLPCLPAPPACPTCLPCLHLRHFSSCPFVFLPCPSPSLHPPPLSSLTPTHQEGVINGVPGCTPQLVLTTMGDGNCLSHSCSLGVWGIHDRDGRLRWAGGLA